MKRWHQIRKYLTADRLGIVLKSADTVLMSMMIVMTLTVWFRSTPAVMTSLFPAIIMGFVVFTISAISTHMISQEKAYRSFALALLGLAVIVFAEGVILNAPFDLYKLFRSVAFAYIWVVGQNYEVSHDRIKTVRQITIPSVVVMSFLIYVLFRDKFGGTFQSVGDVYFPFYCVVAFLNLNLVNMRTAYDVYESNGINRDANLSRFSRVSVTVIILLFIVFQMRHLGLFQLLVKGLFLLQDGIILVLQLLTLPFIYLITLLTGLVTNGDKLHEVKFGEIQLKSEEFFDGHPETGVSQVAEILFTILAVVGIILVVYFILKKVSHKKKRTIAPGAEEERTFIFDMKNPLSGLLKKWTNRYHEEVLHSKIRLKYREALSNWKQKGYEKKRHLSPDEFLQELKDKGQHEPEFIELTQAYKSVRYGNRDE